MKPKSQISMWCSENKGLIGMILNWQRSWMSLDAPPLRALSQAGTRTESRVSGGQPRKDPCVNKYRIDHPEKVAAKKRADYLANPAPAKQRAREWLKANPEHTKLRTARRRAAVKTHRVTSQERT